MVSLPNYWRYRANLPTAPALKPENQPEYLMELFRQAFQDGVDAARAEMREALGIPLIMKDE